MGKGHLATILHHDGKEVFEKPSSCKLFLFQNNIFQVGNC